MTDGDFDGAELATLRGHGIALFAGRVVHEARPPIAPERLAEVARACAGPLPDDLVALWATTAGGRLDYDLSLDLPGDPAGGRGASRELVSFTELFAHDDDGGGDLPAWIEHEQDLAVDVAREQGRDVRWTDRLPLDAVPIGGFEHLERVYVRTGGPEHGAVVVWRQGLPGWTGQPEHDTFVPLAPDLRSAFAALHLDAEPADGSGTGSELLAHVADRVDDGLDPDLAARVLAVHRRAVVDWRGALDAGRILSVPAAWPAALTHAVTTDDAALVRRLAGTGGDLGAALAGTSTAVDRAVVHRAVAALEALLDAGAPVGPGALDVVGGPLPPALVARLLAAGARPGARTAVELVAVGAPDAAAVVADAVGDPDALARERSDALARGEATLADVRAGRSGHHLTVDELAERVRRLRGLDVSRTPTGRSDPDVGPTSP